MNYLVHMKMVGFRWSIHQINILLYCEFQKVGNLHHKCNVQKLHAPIS